MSFDTRLVFHTTSMRQADSRSDSSEYIGEDSDVVENAGKVTSTSEHGDIFNSIIVRRTAKIPAPNTAGQRQILDKSVEVTLHAFICDHIWNIAFTFFAKAFFVGRIYNLHLTCTRVSKTQFHNLFTVLTHFKHSR